MSKTIEKLKRRKRVTITLDNGEEIAGRALTMKEISEADQLSDEHKGLFVLGLMLLEDDGSQSIPRGDLDANQFAKHVESELAEVDMPTIAEVSEKWRDAQVRANPKAIAKN